jgi:hypothetical protein
MSLPQTFSVPTSGSVSTAQMPSTKVRVSVGANAVFYAVGLNPVANITGCEVIPSQTVRYINMQGLGNQIAFIANVGTSTVTVQPIGAVYPTAVAQNYANTALYISANLSATAYY